MSDGEQESRHELVMPFVAVASKGGPFDDGAYAAGYEMGLLDELLANRYTFGFVARTLRQENREQADLIAMRYGWKTRFDAAESTDEWVCAEFVRIDHA